MTRWFAAMRVTGVVLAGKPVGAGADDSTLVLRGSDYTLTINSTGRVAVLQLPPAMIRQLYAVGDSAFMHVPGITRRVFEKMTDSFDLILLVNDQEEMPTGAGGRPDTSWSSHTVRLDSLIGKAVRFRFRTRASGRYYPQEADDFGVWVDDIAVDGTEEVLGETRSSIPATGNAFNLTPNAPGIYRMRLRLNEGCRSYAFGPEFVAWTP